LRQWELEIVFEIALTQRNVRMSQGFIYLGKYCFAQNRRQKVFHRGFCVYSGGLCIYAVGLVILKIEKNYTGL